MDILNLIKSRRSIREYKKEEIPESSIKSILDAARWAPSEGNLQPWKFFVIKDSKIKSALARAALWQNFIKSAPVVIVVCADLDATSPYGARGISLYCLQSTAAAIQNMLLTAHSLGLGTCWVGAFKESEVSKLLNLSEHIRPVAIIPLGFPSETPAPPERREINEIAEFL